MRISDWSSDVCSSDHLPRGECLVRGCSLLDKAHGLFNAGHVCIGQHLAQLLLELFTEATNAAPSRVSRSEEHTSELQSLMRISYAVFCLKKKKTDTTKYKTKQ